MNIGLDVSPIADGNWTGVGNYIINLINDISKIDKENKYYLCYRFSHIKNKAQILKIDQDNFRTKIIQEPLNFIFQLKLDIFHGMADRLPWSYRSRNIVTIHDIGAAVLGDNYASKHFKEMMIKRYDNMLNKKQADLVITVSEFTKREILNNFAYPEEKIRVIYHGVRKMFSPQSEQNIRITKEKYGINSDYFLYVGAINLRKNILRILEAFKIFSENNKMANLVLTGNLSYGHQEILDKIYKLKLESRVKLIGYMKNEELASLYSGAKALIFASLYEGFGLPAIEAMACGTPVLTSNMSSMPEITGGAACMVDPLDVSDIAKNLSVLAEDDNLRKMLSEKGLERARIFSWEKAARETLKVYNEFVNR
ncbi:MAG: glycosyltransferase family 1 protein [bacterium]|nr:glycosyltransferase family 1 protein [bacterium]